MAGEYSRELSVKVFAGQCRLIEHGFRQGGPAGFGLRRLLIDEGLALEDFAASLHWRVAICSTGVGTSVAGGARSREAAMASTLVGKQAVVIGAGMGGLAAAGALADRFDQVVVLERDTLPSEPTYRAGTPGAGGAGAGARPGGAGRPGGRGGGGAGGGGGGRGGGGWRLVRCFFSE